VLDDPDDPEPSEEDPPPVADPVIEAKEALIQAQQAFQAKIDLLPRIEAAAEVRSRVIEALGAKLAVMEGCRLGVFTGDDQARVHVGGCSVR
jgi:hypothetical protein